MTRTETFGIVLSEEFESLVGRLFLTDRQKDIMRLRFSSGLHNQEIADKLNISLSIVKKECRVIKRKLEFIKREAP